MILLVRTLARFALALATLAAGSAFAASQMHKCVEGGRTVYQQQACPVASQVEAAPAAASGAKAASEQAANLAARVRPALAPASAAPAMPR